MQTWGGLGRVCKFPCINFLRFLGTLGWFSRVHQMAFLFIKDKEEPGDEGWEAPAI